MNKIRECNICEREFELNETNFLRNPTCIDGFQQRCRWCHYRNKSTKTGHRNMVDVWKRQAVRLGRKIDRLEKINIELTNRIVRLERRIANLERKNSILHHEAHRPDGWRWTNNPANANEAEIYIAKLTGGKLLYGLPYDILTPNNQRVEVKSTRSAHSLRLQSGRPYDWLVIIRRNRLFLLSKRDVLGLGQENVGGASRTLYPFRITPEQLVERISNGCHD